MYHWISLNELYKLMESFFVISFFDFLGENWKNFKWITNK